MSDTVTETPFYYPGLEQYTEEELSKLGSVAIACEAPLVKADRIAYVLFERPDLDQQETFLLDFGLVTYENTDNALFMRGCDDQPYCFVALKGDTPRYLGCGFFVDSREELQTLAEAGENASPIEPLSWPGGGERVRMHDPDGFIVDVIYGRNTVEPLAHREEPLPVNTPNNKARINQGQRREFAPSKVVRLGHVAMMATDYARSIKWYTKHLGILLSDNLCLHDGTPTLSFTRLDRGDKPADHHTLAIAGGPLPMVMHVAFETVDIDEIGQGQQYLKTKGWDHHWGIGRHILGSQVFDYWRDPYGTEFEHYADGDVFTADQPAGHAFFDQGGLWQWGDDYPVAQPPELPEEMLQPEPRKDYLMKWQKALGRFARPWLK
ncbi:VOC family protein [Maricurvus nonylphenolicus]|uniref:VOC family protein n=1 Tax=Maricurvus nonylphenolicus TaxID=1008307 RepID=UPI0036F31C09